MMALRNDDRNNNNYNKADEDDVEISKRTFIYNIIKTFLIQWIFCDFTLTLQSQDLEFGPTMLITILRVIFNLIFIGFKMFKTSS